MEFVIISGMSGAGKTSALHIMEDIGYYCVDNIPTSLLQTLYKLCKDSSDKAMKRVAVVVDVRGNGDYEVMYDDLENFKKNNEGVKSTALLCAIKKQEEDIRLPKDLGTALLPPP